MGTVFSRRPCTTHNSHKRKEVSLVTANWKIVRSTLVWLLIALMTMGIVIASPYVMKSEAASAPQTVTVAKASNGKWGAVKNGKIDTSVSGVYKNSYGWWYVKNGLVQFGYNGIQKNQYGWWRIEKGKVNFKATGVYKNEYGWWRVEDGKVNFKAGGIYKNNYGWWKTTGGKVTFKENGVFKNEYGWWKVEDSKVNFNFSGIASNKYGTWYLKDGKVDFKKNDIVEFEGKKYQVTDGKATLYTEPDTPTPAKTTEEMKKEAVEIAKEINEEYPVSRQMLINALKEEYPEEVAVYAADNAGINYFTNALLTTDELLGDWDINEYNGLSEALYADVMKEDFLFTEEEIEYCQGIIKAEANKNGNYWKEQCRAAAKQFQEACKEDKDLEWNKQNLKNFLTELAFTADQINTVLNEYFPG